MSGIGWEFYGIKFSILVTMITAVVMVLSVLFGTRKGEHFSHVDGMAGDEGDD